MLPKAQTHNQEAEILQVPEKICVVVSIIRKQTPVYFKEGQFSDPEKRKTKKDLVSFTSSGPGRALHYRDPGFLKQWILFL